MKWLKRKIYRWINSAYDDEECYSVEVGQSPVVRNSIDVEGLAFNVMPAQGGTIVQARQYDRKTDRSTNSTHIIAEGKDVAEEVGKIVAMELWKV